METYLLELGERAVAYLNGGIDRNVPTCRFREAWAAEHWIDTARSVATFTPSRNFTSADADPFDIPKGES